MARVRDGIINYPRTYERKNRKATNEQVKAALLEKGSIKAAAASLGIDRSTLQDRIRHMRESGDLLTPRVEANPSRWRPAQEIIAARKAEFARVKAANRAGGNIVHLADDGPFCVMFLGDPHLDSKGTDLDLWEHWIGYLDHRKHVHGFGLGDWLDNWVKPLAHLYAESETPAPEGWIELEYYLDQIAEHLIGSVGGNHDAWSGSSDLLAYMMRDRGVLHQSDELDVRLRTRSGRDITVGSRHSWPGTSMWNPVHGIMRAAQMGRAETILVGGHTHVSGEGRVKHPERPDGSGATFTWCIQVAAFKTQDEYAKKKGFTDKHASPAVAAVIDPRRADTDPDLVTLFFKPESAVAHLTMLRRAAKTGSAIEKDPKTGGTA